MKTHNYSIKETPTPKKLDYVDATLTSEVLGINTLDCRAAIPFTGTAIEKAFAPLLTTHSYSGEDIERCQKDKPAFQGVIITTFPGAFIPDIEKVAQAYANHYHKPVIFWIGNKWIQKQPKDVLQNLMNRHRNSK